MVGYCITEFEMLQKAAPELASELDACYLNANAASWFRNHESRLYERLYKELRLSDPYAKPGLKDFLQLHKVGYEYPAYLLGFSPAKAIAKIRLQVSKRVAHAPFAPTAKRTWTKLSSYNRHDVLGMKFLTAMTVKRREQHKA